MTSEHWLSTRVRAARTEHSLEAGQSLFRSGDKTAGLYEIVKGQVRLVRTDASGRETVFYSAGPGNVIAEASLFSPVYHCDALASANSVVRLYPRSAILAEFQRDPAAAQAFMAMLAREIMRLRTRLELGNIHSARAAFATISRSTRPRMGAPSRCQGRSRNWQASSGSATRRCTVRSPRCSATAKSPGRRRRITLTRQAYDQDHT